MDSLIKPRISEKAYALSIGGIYVFEVSNNLNKIEIKKLVEDRFKVVVINVRTLLNKGKAVRTVRLGDRKNRPATGRRKDVKLAYVTLKKGDTINVSEFSEVKE
jgi:large subunit ribosomal protein L23